MVWLFGEIKDRNIKTEFVKLDETEFTEIEQSVDSFNSKEDLIEYINGKKYDNNKLYKIILTGKRSFDVNCREILNLISVRNVLKIKDLTKFEVNLDKLKNENTLKGLFVKEALNKLDEGIYTKEEIEKAIEIGLSNM